jgi:hypothetical protein
VEKRGRRKKKGETTLKCKTSKDRKEGKREREKERK